MTDSQNDDGGGGLPTAAYDIEFERNHVQRHGSVVRMRPPKDHRDDIINVNELVRRFDVKALIQEMSKKTAMQSEYNCEICDADPGYCTCSTALQNLWNKIEVEEELEQ